MVLARLTHILRRTNSEMREKSKEKTRSPLWSRARDEYVKEHPECAACSSKNHLQVHHIKPFHIHPELELDPTNFIVLCMDIDDCHLNIGHGDSFKAYNPNVREDAAKFLSSSKEDRKLITESAKKNRLS